MSRSRLGGVEEGRDVAQFAPIQPNWLPCIRIGHMRGSWVLHVENKEQLVSFSLPTILLFTYLCVVPPISSKC